MYSMLHFTSMAHMGVKGLVLNRDGDAVPNAKVKVKGNSMLVSTNKNGEYWKILTPGNYSLVGIKFNFDYILALKTSGSIC